MGLAASQAQLLMLTARKADCEYGISIDSMHKMALTREMSQLSEEYYSRLQTKQLAYYANGQYHNITPSYLLGGASYRDVLDGNVQTKTENSMVLTDYKGQTILSQGQAEAITKVLGTGIMNAQGQGSTFSTDQIAAILAAFTNNGYSEEDFKTVLENGTVSSSYENTHDGISDNTEQNTSEIQRLVDFYYPIFSAAAANGWTTEYNEEMSNNKNYLGDAIASGIFQLATVNEQGDYDDNRSLAYFITAGLVTERTDSDIREEITAWYNAEKARISEKENYIDIHMTDLSTELEAIKTEIESIKSFIDDATSSVFDWGAG